MFTIPVRDMESFRDFSILLDGSAQMRTQQELAVTQPEGQWWIEGHCEVCDADRQFLADYQYGGDFVNWRERLECSGCLLNNRMRAALALAKTRLKPNARVYLTERVTPLYRETAKAFSEVIGSEYMPDVPRGEERDGIRSEDVTRLTFGEQFDAVMTFDVMEHVPDYRQGLREFARVLKPGGWLIMTVPYNLGDARTTVRATIVDGKILHLETPEYHGDPMNGNGILSFYTFGWSLLEDLRAVGLSPQLEFYWSRNQAYLGGLQFIIVAQKPSS